MPIFPYKCPNCHHTWEEIRSGADAPALASCPLCKHPSPKTATSASLVFKGSGWTPRG